MFRLFNSINVCNWDSFDCSIDFLANNETHFMYLTWKMSNKWQVFLKLKVDPVVSHQIEIWLRTRHAHFSRFWFLARCEKKLPISREKLREMREKVFGQLGAWFHVILAIFKAKLLLLRYQEPYHFYNVMFWVYHHLSNYSIKITYQKVYILVVKKL